MGDEQRIDARLPHPNIAHLEAQGSYGALSFCLPVQAKLRLDFGAAGMPAENYSADPVTL